MRHLIPILFLCLLSNCTSTQVIADKAEATKEKLELLKKLHKTGAIDLPTYTKEVEETANQCADNYKKDFEDCKKIANKNVLTAERLRGSIKILYGVILVETLIIGALGYLKFF